MTMRHLLAIALFLQAGLLSMPHAARAAQSYDNCNNFIDSLPATISTQGVWCLRHDLATNIASGNAITIATNNVTIDCNDFKIGGLAAGTTSTASGIYAYNRQNAAIRHCNIRGFYNGINLAGNDGAGHLIEDNRLDNNLYIGISVTGEHNRVRRNAIFDTGGYANSAYPTAGSTAYGISASASITNNTIDGVFTTVTTNTVWGIQAMSDGAQVIGNMVDGLLLNGGGVARGISATTSSATISGNIVTARFASTNGYGIAGWTTTKSFCSDNSISQFTTAMSNCADDGGNGLH
jgi:hypothetical protein